MKRLLLLLCAPAVLAGLPGCASFGVFANSGEPVVSYAPDAEENMKRGDRAMAVRSFEEASKYYEYVKTKFPYREDAKTAELKLADSDYERERYTEARDRYQTFVRLHPTHPEVAYAAFRAALTHYKDIPSDFFLVPKATEKEQVEVKGALTALNEFLLSYPDSKYVPEAKKVLVDVKRRLAEHEVSVADFYAQHGRWPGVVNRLTTLSKRFDGIGYDSKAAFGLYEAYRKLDQPAKAASALEDFVTKHPEDPDAPKARALLASLPKEAPPEASDAGR